MTADGLPRWLVPALCVLPAWLAVGYTPLTKGTPADLVAVLILAAALASVSLRSTLTRRSFLVPVAAVAGTLLIGVILSPVPGEAALVAAKLLTWVGVARLYFYAGRHEKSARWLAASLVVPAVGLALAGVINLGIAIAGVHDLPGADHYGRFPLGFSVTRFVGFHPTANDQALVFLLAVVVASLVVSPLRSRLWLSLIMTVGVATTFSRLLVMALLVTGSQLRSRLSRRAWIAVLIAIGLWQIGAEAITHVAVSRTATIDSPWVTRPAPFAAADGIYLWRMRYLDLKIAAVQAWSQQPVFGVGIRGFVRQPETAELVDGLTAHSTYGFLLSELGLVGLLTVLVVLGFAVRQVRELADDVATWDIFCVVVAVTALDYDLHHQRLVFIVAGLMSGSVCRRLTRPPLARAQPQW